MSRQGRCGEPRFYESYNGRKVTSNGYTQCIDMEGKPIVITTKHCGRQPLMMGVSEFGLPDRVEFFKSENHKSTKKVGARFIVWAPKASDKGTGITVDGNLYREVQEHPEEYPDKVAQLKEFGLPLDIDFR